MGEVTCSKKWNEQSTNKDTHNHTHTHTKVTQNVRQRRENKGKQKSTEASFLFVRPPAEWLCPGVLMSSAHC